MAALGENGRRASPSPRRFFSAFAHARFERAPQRCLEGGSARIMEHNDPLSPRPAAFIVRDTPRLSSARTASMQFALL
jgi:hypothetical protein